RCTKPLTLYTSDIVQVSRLFGFELKVTAVSVGESRADTAIPQRAQVGVGVSTGYNVVRPVMNRRQAGVDRLGDSQFSASVGIFRRHDRPAPAHTREIIENTISDNAASEATPEMKMGIDKARASDPIATVDFFGARRVKRGADGNQCAIAHVHVADGNVAEFCIHRDNV